MVGNSTKPPYIISKISYLPRNCYMGIAAHEANIQIQHMWPEDQHLSKKDSL